MATLTELGHETCLKARLKERDQDITYKGPPNDDTARETGDKKVGSIENTGTRSKNEVTHAGGISQRRKSSHGGEKK